MDILIYPNDIVILHTSCTEVEVFDQDLEKLAYNMHRTMKKAKGIGLAAPQVGVSKEDSAL